MFYEYHLTDLENKITDEWKEIGIKEHRDYAILTAEISKAIFGMTPSELLKIRKLEDRKNTSSLQYSIVKNSTTQLQFF